MKGGDFTDDPFGTPRPGTFDGLFSPMPMASSTSSIPYSGTPFQCDAPALRIAPDPDRHPERRRKLQQNSPSPPAAERRDGRTSGLAMYPYPTQQHQQCSGGITSPTCQFARLNEGKFDIRLDHNFSNKDSIFARFSYDQATSFVPGGSPGFAEQGAFASTQDITNHARNVVISETHLSPTARINQITGGFNRIFNITSRRRKRQLRGAEQRPPGRQFGQSLRRYRLPES